MARPSVANRNCYKLDGNALSGKQKLLQARWQGPQWQTEIVTSWPLKAVRTYAVMAMNCIVSFSSDYIN